MVVDSSAVIAILEREPEAELFAGLMEEAAVRLISAVSVLECGMLALSRRGAAGVRELDLFLGRGGFDIVPFDADQAAVARGAFDVFGKGRHPAGLNFGDCASYALSRTAAEPLLFKGDDFGRTDLETVVDG